LATRKPSIAGRRAPSKNALVNKNALETSAAANASSNQPKPSAAKQASLGSFGLLAGLGVNKVTSIHCLLHNNIQ
jgi:hypothetical protein